MLANDVGRHPGTRLQIERRRPRSWRADEPDDISEALVTSVLAIVLIVFAIIGSIAIREPFVYFRDVFSM